MAVLLQPFVKVAVIVKVQRPLAELPASDHLRFHAFSCRPLKRHSLARAHFPPWMHQRRPRLCVLAPRAHQQNLYLAREPGAMPIQSRWKNFRIVQHQAIARAKKLRKLPKYPVFPGLLRAMEHQHSRPRAIGQRLLRDRRLRQVIMKLRKVQFTPYVKILGIETSCDETAAAVVEDGSVILSSVVASQLATHGKYGGVVPELASREHLRAIVPVVRQALEQADTTLDDLAAIAVTEGPGLVGSLLVGITYAKALSFASGLPLIAVNHIEGHIHAVILEAGSKIEYPAVALVASGGHTHLFEVRDGFRYRLLGKTRDDAAGEAYDKVAKLLGFGYPGGPVIDQLAPHGNPRAIKFTLAHMKGNTLDFSFSGLKTAVLRWVQERDLTAEIEARRKAQGAPLQELLALTPQPTLDLLASFQYTVIAELLRRATVSIEKIGARSLIVSGGVASNAGLRAAAREAAFSCPVFFPTPALSTDNAAMIAAAAYPKLQTQNFSGFDLKAQANLTLA